MADAGSQTGGAGPLGGTDRRFGFVAIIGAPNAGKSTLVNRLVGAKVSIVSRKVQTTRSTIRGIFVEGSSQVVLVDTPGIFSPKRRLDRAMVDAAWGGAGDADLTALVVDAAKGLDDDVDRIIGRLAKASGSRILILNKVDRVSEKDELLALAGALTTQLSFDRVFMISAENGSGVADLKRYLADAVPAGVWHYAEDELTDFPMRQLASEITRERILDRLHQELPYKMTVETTDWQEFKNGAVRIEQTIFVTRPQHKMIVLGKGGQTIKAISSESRAELGRILERVVHLFLFVKVREGWEADPERYREMGLEFPKK